MKKETKKDMVVIFSELVGQDKNKDFLANLENQNKAKEWDLIPIDITVKDGHLIGNAEDIEKKVILLRDNLNLSLDGYSMQDLESFKSKFNIISNWLIGTRTQLTAPFNAMVKTFTSYEKILKEINQTLKNQEIKLNEKNHQTIKIKIIEEFENLKKELKNSHDIVIDLTVFESWIDKKKTLKGYTPNSKGALNSSPLKDIKTEFDLVANPLINAKIIQVQKDKEQMYLSDELARIITTGADGDLHIAEKTLDNLEMRLETHYPNIKETAKAQINNYKNMIKNSLRANEINREKEQKEEIDKELLARFSDENLELELDDITYLSNKADDLKITFGDMKYFRTEAQTQIQKLEIRISTLKQNELKKLSVKEEPKDENIEDLSTDKNDEEVAETPIETELINYKISDEDVEYFKTMIISAKNKDEAKVMMTENIKFQLDMIDLIKIGD